MNLRSFEFRRERQRTWTELGRLVEKVEKSGVRALNADQLARLPVLYHATLSSLSVARAISLDRALLDYLESLAARAYFCVYGTKRSLRDTVAEFFARRFPQTVRLFRWHIALSALFLLAGTVTALAMTLSNLEWFYTFVDAEYAQGRNPATSTLELRKVLYGGGKDSGSELGAFTSFLFTHNARVGMMAFALGFAAGLPVYILLFMNGMILGAFGALYQSRGLGMEFWGWVMPHGVTELSAVVLCGGAGLMLAHALVFPGRRTRLQNLARQGRAAGTIVMGCVAMFFVAALIEGIFRQRVHDVMVRYLVIVVTAVAWGYYFVRAGARR